MCKPYLATTITITTNIQLHRITNTLNITPPPPLCHNQPRDTHTIPVSHYNASNMAIVLNIILQHVQAEPNHSYEWHTTLINYRDYRSPHFVLNLRSQSQSLNPLHFPTALQVPIHPNRVKADQKPHSFSYCGCCCSLMLISHFTVRWRIWWWWWCWRNGTSTITQSSGD